MKFKFILFSLSLAFTLLSANGWANNPGGKDPVGTPTTLADEEYEDRLCNISYAFNFILTDKVKDRIAAQTSVRGRITTERILGLSRIYYPIFEAELLRNNIPYQLKYVPVVESQFNTTAVSPKGAGGLWQFMPSTAKMFHMVVNKEVDERYDTYKATAAAAKLFTLLYDKYGDWALVLAAYNAGPVRVDNAIKAASSNNYWDICKYLPMETQKYVPFFIAAAYIDNYYALHDLTPTELPEELVSTDTIHIFKRTTFNQIAEETGASIETIKFLNPAFLRNVIPKSADGYVLTLPVQNMVALKGEETQATYAVNNANATEAIVNNHQVSTPVVTTVPRTTISAPIATAALTNNSTTQAKVKYTHTVGKSDKVAYLAQVFRCTEAEIRAWNNLREGEEPAIGSLIAIRESVTTPTPVVASLTKPTAPVAKTTTAAAPAKAESKVSKLSGVSTHLNTKKNGALSYQLQAGDSLWKLVKQHPEVTWEQVVALNGMDKIKNAKVGDYIRLK